VTARTDLGIYDDEGRIDEYGTSINGGFSFSNPEPDVTNRSPSKKPFDLGGAEGFTVEDAPPASDLEADTVQLLNGPIVDVVVIPEHYVPIEQIEFLRPADKIRQYAQSDVVAHRVYIARSLPDILPKITRQSTFNDTLLFLHSLATDLNEAVRLAVAGSLGALLLSYGQARMAASRLPSGRLQSKSTDSLLDLHRSTSSISSKSQHSSKESLNADPSSLGIASSSSASNNALISMLQQSTPKNQRVYPDSSGPFSSNSSFLPQHFLNTLVLPILLDNLDRVKQTAREGIAKSIKEEPSGDLGRTLITWAIMLLDLSGSEIMALIENFYSTLAATADTESSKMVPTEPLRSSTTSPVMSPLVSRFIDHTSCYKSGEPSYASPRSERFSFSGEAESHAKASALEATESSSPTVLPTIDAAAQYIRRGGSISKYDVASSDDEMMSHVDEVKLNGNPEVRSLLLYFFEKNTQAREGSPIQGAPNDPLSSWGSLNKEVNVDGDSYLKASGPVISKRLDELHAHILELISEAFGTHLDAVFGSNIVEKIVKTYSLHASASIRAAAVSALGACVPYISVESRLQMLSLALESFSQDPMYATRRKVAADLVPNLVEMLLPGSKRQDALKLVETLLRDKSKAVRDAMYGGLPRILLAFALNLSSNEANALTDKQVASELPKSHHLNAERKNSENPGTITQSVSNSSFEVVEDPQDSDAEGEMRVPGSNEPKGIGSCPPVIMKLEWLDPQEDLLLHFQMDSSDSFWEPLPDLNSYAQAIPRILMDNFCLVNLKWKDPDRVTRCAWSIPGVVANLVRSRPKWWYTRFRGLYSTLARDALQDVRAPLHHSLDFLTRALPSSYVANDILPVVQSWMENEDESTRSLLREKLPRILSRIFPVAPNQAFPDCAEIVSAHGSWPAYLPPHLICCQDSSDLNGSESSWRMELAFLDNLCGWLHVYARPGFLEFIANIAEDETALKELEKEQTDCGTRKAPNSGSNFPSIRPSSKVHSSRLHRSWTLLRARALEGLCTRHATIRSSTAREIARIITFVAKNTADYIFKDLMQLAESDSYRERAAAAHVVSHLVPLVSKEPSATHFLDTDAARLVQERVGTLLKALAHDPVVDVRVVVAIAVSQINTQELHNVSRKDDSTHIKSNLVESIQLLSKDSAPVIQQHILSLP
jgi:hypothetical protein